MAGSVGSAAVDTGDRGARLVGEVVSYGDALTDGVCGLQVVRVMAAARTSIEQGGAPVRLAPARQEGS
jgi:hypothetical protein